jgi:hypothetical protein
MYFAPIVVQDGERRVVRLARYHCRRAEKLASIDRKFPGLYNARRDNLEKSWRREFGHTSRICSPSTCGSEKFFMSPVTRSWAARPLPTGPLAPKDRFWRPHLVMLFDRMLAPASNT